MKSFSLYIFILLLASIPVWGQGSDPTPDPASENFSLDLFHQILQENPGQNLVVSPLSLEIALKMVLNGAEGETREQIEKVLGLEGMTEDQMNQQSAALYGSLADPGEEVEMDIANSIWVDQRCPLLPDFVRVNQKTYGAEMKNLDFLDPGSPEVVNQWVAQKTHGKIQKMLDAFTPYEVVLLLNAVYFKGSWVDPFLETATAPRTFYLENGKTEDVPMMNHSRRMERRLLNFPYQENDLFQAVRLPYKGGRFSFMIFLPKKGKSLRDFFQGLNAQTWDQWLKAFQSMDGELTLPKFKMDSDLGLNQALISLGMKQAFTKGADFAGMTTKPVEISRVLQKAYIEVNEKGTEAAAATGVIIIENARRMETPFHMVVDRPFAYTLYDRRTNKILFLGAVYDPK